MQVFARREKKTGVGPSADKIHSSAGKKKKEMTRLSFFFLFFCSYPIIRLREGDKRGGE